MSLEDCPVQHPDDEHGFEGSELIRTCDFRLGHYGPHRTTWTTEDGSAFQDEWDGSDRSSVRAVPHS